MTVIFGATGHTGSIIANHLLDAGKPVTVVGRSADKLQSFEEKGAIAAIGDMTDSQFMSETIKSATAVYFLIPPNFGLTDFRAYQHQVVDMMVSALKDSAVTHVVTLSSFGAHLPEKGGVVQGLHYMETQLNQFKNLNLVHLRAGFFFENFLGNVGLLKGQGLLGGFPIDGHVKLSLVHTRDIAAMAIELLTSLNFTGHSVRFVAGTRDYTLDEFAGIIGDAVGKPGLTWTRFPDEGARQGMIQMGLPEDMANLYVELTNRMNDGSLSTGFVRDSTNTTATSAEDFAKEFAQAYQQA